jgi:hypothetical protein
MFKLALIDFNIKSNKLTAFLSNAPNDILSYSSLLRGPNLMKTTQSRLKIKNFTISIALLVALSLQARQVSAGDVIRPYVENVESGHFLYAIYNNRWLMKKEEGVKLAAITGLSPGAKGNLVIPSSLDGIEVYGIDENAFSSCKGIKSVTIPKTVRFLRPGTLNRCQGLENIVVAEDHPEFASVDGVMFDKQKSKLLAIGSGRSGHYRVPDTTTAIGQLAFSLCTNLKRVTIPENVTDIGGFQGAAFQGCSKLERIDIPDTITNIGQKSFQDCNSLRQATIPSKVTRIPFGLFWRCGSLASVTLPDGITSIGNYAFADCTKVTLRSLPGSLTTIGAYGFKDCKGLKGLTVPESVTTIGRNAFRGCDVKMSNKQDAGDGK